ncbi:hypothetical protein CNMCM6106_009297 [Aspergillus hiratsukae]|uniref:Hcy-binding domain-containing protein n=1 Tax=Aspergillus hiratsukae TaxID=1194566 RepID=A0A8H6PL07_9EURO|nr:hypothetical protein CNMCM6106_009297 [Aspergillus hiratsukae]
MGMLFSPPMALFLASLASRTAARLRSRSLVVERPMGLAQGVDPRQVRVSSTIPVPVAAAMEMVWGRIGLIKANASLKSHEELDNSETVDRGDIAVYTDGFENVLPLVPNVKVIGGCCGTDEEHLEAIAKRCIK